MLLPEYSAITCTGRRREHPHCTGPLNFEEEGLKVEWNPSQGEKVQLIAVDGGLITSGSRCDALYLSHKEDLVLTLVELKTAELAKAIDQLIATKDHRKFQEVIHRCRSLSKAVRYRYVVVASPKATKPSNVLAKARREGIKVEIRPTQPYTGKVVALTRRSERL